jgi:serine/threonine protein kinase
MEFLEGEALSSRLSRGPMARDEAVAVLLPLMDALTAFHDAGLIHRDIKPSNVFLTPQGPKLLDFGLARRTQRADAVTAPALTVPGKITGTLRYMAPEQLTGDPVDARTDIFALGVMFFEMLTGRIPFGDGSNTDWFNAVLTEEPPPLDDPELSRLDPVVSRALQRKPEGRYATVAEMSAALRESLQTDSPAAPAREAASNRALRAVVLPFRLLQDDPDIAALQHGVPEGLTALLSGREGWQFLSNRVAQESGEEPDLVAVGRSLRVDRLLTGSILRAGDDFRITVQLIDAADGSVQWSQTSHHTAESVVALQDAICRQIVEGFPQTPQPSNAAH